MFYGTCLFSFLARPMHRLNFDPFQIFRAKLWPFLNFEGFPHGRAESAAFYRTNHVVGLGLVAKDLTLLWEILTPISAEPNPYDPTYVSIAAIFRDFNVIYVRFLNYEE